MAGSFSNYLELELLDHVYGGADYSRPATLYVALFSVDPSDAGGGTELSGDGYERVAVTNNSTNWPAADAGAKSNGAAITFPTATGDWDEVTAHGIFDHATAGNLLSWGELTVNKTALTGDTIVFNIGDLDITLD